MADDLTVRQGGHVTLLFTVESDQRLPRDQGSCGAGFSIHHGVQATGRLVVQTNDLSFSEGEVPDERAEPPMPKASVISILDRHGQPVATDAIYRSYLEACRYAKLLRPNESLHLELQLECPLSQGFGMSAAGLMALGDLLHRLTGRGARRQYLIIAHQIERRHSGGLGDVLGASVGGVELRTHPGAPGWPGQAQSFDADMPVLLAWTPSEHRHTSSYIDDPDWKHAITEAGRSSVQRLKAQPWSTEVWPMLLDEAEVFAATSGMVNEPMRAALLTTVETAVDALGMSDDVAVRLCMLGTSVAVIPFSLPSDVGPSDLKGLAERCEAAGVATLLTHLGSTHSTD